MSIKIIRGKIAKVLLGGILLAIPIYVIHAQLGTSAGITFSVDANGNWQYTSGFHDNGTHYQFVTSDGRGGNGAGTDTKDTSIPSSIQMEVLVADTHGASFSSPCSSPHFTGNPSSDLACEAAAAEKQGYAYTVGQTWQEPATTTQQQPAADSLVKDSPCKCP